MRILLDCRPLQSLGWVAEKSRLVFAAATALSASEGIEWVLLFDRRYRSGHFPVLPGKVVIRRALPGLAGWRYWYDRQIARLAREEGVDKIWLTGGISGVGSVGSCVWMPERVDQRNAGGLVSSGFGLGGLGWGGLGYRSLFRRRLKSGFTHGETIVCYSDRDRAWLVNHRPDLREKIQVLRAVPEDTIKPLPAAEKEKVKAEWTQGMDYFLADVTGCSERELVDLLKGFSFFKKRQRSGMRLVMVGGSGVRERIAERLESYKYRQDVDWPAEGGRQDLTGAAYAVVLPVEGSGIGTTLLDRWKAGVPVIAASGGLWEEMAQGAVLGMAPGDPASLAAQLMRIYKEEDLRTELIGKGFERLKVYSRENFLRLLQVITEIAAC
jgi:glycosyltransferase involved in cell wall biosynthesis